jgi:hypothetical protein
MCAAVTAKPLGLLYDCAAHEGDGTWLSLGGKAAQAVLRTRNWHKFIIGPDIPELIVPFQYASQLHKHDLFRLPFDEVVVQYGPGSISQNLQRSVPTRFHRLFDKDKPLVDNGDFYIAIIQQKQETLEGRSFVINPSTLTATKSFGHCVLQKGEEHDEYGLADYIADDPSLPKDSEDYVIEKSTFMLLTYVLVGLVNAEGIIQEHHRTPKFINKKREAKGKLPLFEYHLLKISPALKMPGHVAAGGTHASPRLHWRRGHIRRLPSGACTQVRPCLVGHKSLGQIEKDYLVGNGSTEELHQPIPHDSE